MPWVDTIVHDLYVLREALRPRLDELPSPSVDLTPWWELARDFPSEWKALVDRYTSAREDWEPGGGDETATNQ